jgi:hypothetical protein
MTFFNLLGEFELSFMISIYGVACFPAAEFSLKPLRAATS